MSLVGPGIIDRPAGQDRPVDETVEAARLLTSALVGRDVTRVLLDYAVTLQFWAYGYPTLELKLETEFELLDGRTTEAIRPGQLGQHAARVAGLFGQVVESVALGRDAELRIAFVAGPTVRASMHGDYESWSFVSDTGDQIVCLPSGGVAIWSRPGGREN
jgi:hypothetical protein